MSTTKIAFFLFWLLCFTSTSAQELKVLSMTICENDSSAILKPQKDFNNDLCSLIKVQLRTSGATFEGDIVGDVKNTLKEYWVYMPEDSRYLTILHRDYLPIDVNFNDYLHESIQSGKTYAIEVQIPDVLIDKFSPEELYTLGMEYYEGHNGKKKSLIEAEYLLHRAADRGNSDAQVMLANMVLDREDLNRRKESEYIERNEKERNLQEKWILAEYWFLKAVKQGNPKAMTGMGRCELNKVKHVSYKYQVKHREEAMKWLKKAAGLNDRSAFYWLGYCYHVGYYSKQLFGSNDYKNAFFWYMKAAEAGDPNGMRLVATFYDKGYDIKKDTLQAFRWYQKAANQGDLFSQYIIAQFYEKGEFVQRGPITAFEYYDIAAKRGYAPAQNQLGVCYLKGFGVSEDPVQAISWFHKAAEQGNAESCFWLGKCHDEGFGVEIDEKKALKWYKRAIENYDTRDPHAAEAFLAVGQKYMEGKIVKEDPKYASECLGYAATLKNANAQYLYGKVYTDGYGVNKNIKLAKIWLTKAAKQGHAKAMEALKELEDIDK